MIRVIQQIFRILKKFLLVAFSITLIVVTTGYFYLYELPKGPEVTSPKKMNTGIDSFVMYAYENSEKKSIKVWTYKPKNWKDRDKIVFVMHGGGRNAEDYLNAWLELANSNNLLIVAPEFENKFSKYTTIDYQEGNLKTFFGAKNDRNKWAFTVIENIFDYIKSNNKITNHQYDIFGHSAGGQFVHRMVMLMPESRIGTAIAANSGFYTLPNVKIKFPYGIENIETNLEQSHNKRLIILLGQLDNDPNLGTFRTTNLAMEQGVHRLERGTTFFNLNKKFSSKNNWVFNWEMDTINDVGHDYKKMSKNAMKWLTKKYYQ